MLQAMTDITEWPESRPVDFGFLLLASVFLSSLVVCNLIANKFLTVDLGFKVFTLSAGALPYPITFLATDLMSEIYGKRRADFMVLLGFGMYVPYVTFHTMIFERMFSTSFCSSPVSISSWTLCQPRSQPILATIPATATEATASR